jgi:hypothetical protein
MFATFEVNGVPAPLTTDWHPATIPNRQAKVIALIAIEKPMGCHGGRVTGSHMTGQAALPRVLLVAHGTLEHLIQVAEK